MSEEKKITIGQETAWIPVNRTLAATFTAKLTIEPEVLEKMDSGDFKLVVENAMGTTEYKFKISVICGWTDKECSG
jgi:hypothetical protein